MSKYLGTKYLRSLLRGGGQLSLGDHMIEELYHGRMIKKEPDLQWLFDNAMEPGNSEGDYESFDGERVVFSQAGTCTVGIVCLVSFVDDQFSETVKKKIAAKESLWPEDMNGVKPWAVSIYYDESEDEEI